MTFFKQLEQLQEKNNSLVCPGFDPDMDKIPKHLLGDEDPIFSFCKGIVDTTIDLVCAYKPNIAFFEAYGIKGLESLKKTIDYVHELDGLVIIDAKRNDIGNTAKMYAKSMFDNLGSDALTINPYMGSDSVKPFLEYKDKGIFVLARTSNPGGADFQNLICDGKPLYETVVKKVLEWDENGNAGLVTGATFPEELGAIRKMAPGTTFLVPGIGSQGGDVEKTLKAGLREDGKGLVIVSARGIIYASSGEDFAEAAREATIQLRDEINKYRK
ncbi:MAG: Orotidine 5'-phosphate decarboxylase [candidate division CPR2 bacterium GW2011_GWC1_41_48]|uniref:Orotidine 5'-phosphate decarboxylase n=1 Tax=candidate division CPR2 bacterium GW2011_GWC1_41_48 TaxID=1618344 RepID=A0A0G0W920_UNCC2|nr:MAG: Orotidine 5'-phosphate decarboxylase [candidate division CPR2 bacterium GW2011_GWC2_39_35]KKR28983.1 MAG: Orotidine 5'-phosphate decarboxylase [candidate division CPR2 bacterium GW2011_GWD2_39_7]KKR29259.1 MAG: Orotidine 5'-phosphate decarboxylase [candidate division CPR2 bacterium GW2011_GWD1_39_7]KKS09480.1 MAG: Orotidine 5'-phosphate decarboxylase [candidate division CPR2 bacterium GW2011_GWC1_41_48]OGB62188.1 MAG: orotidine 5'-phosphate decarboxylase [candidate division CPR2 bacteri